jgi:hypothetical protein
MDIGLPIDRALPIERSNAVRMKGIKDKETVKRYLQTPMNAEIPDPLLREWNTVERGDRVTELILFRRASASRAKNLSPHLRAGGFPRQQHN